MNAVFLFESIDRYASESPDSIALSDTRRSYSYLELSKSSKYYAQKICEEMDVSGKHIGLLYDNTAHSIVLMTALMRSGGIYVPLDRSMPIDRINALIDNANIAMVISPDGFEPGCNVRTVVIRQESTSMTPDILTSFTPSPVAYAIFTSGSTGLPKLARLKHASVSHVVRELVNRYYVNKDDKVLQFARLAFDASISEIFTAFMMGAELTVPDSVTRRSITRLASYIEEQKVSIAILPPSLLSSMRFSTAHVKTLVVAGEACPPALAVRFASKVPHFVNAYGPTECSICVSTYEVPEDFDANITPIGSPISNVEIQIRDRNGDLVSDNTPGELCVGGPVLFEGYYNNPQMTAKALFKDDTKDITFYKTGDYVRMNNGTLTYLSRSDDYIKLNGIRISPLEIDSVIYKFNSSIKIAVTISVNVAERDVLLSFYSADRELPDTELLQYLKETLPKHSLPSRIIFLKDMPLSENNKVDKKELTRRAQELYGSLTQAVPSTDLLSTVRSEWSRVLGVEVDERTNFFNAGGDSLGAMRMLAVIDSYLGTHLSLSDLYAHSTLKLFIDHLHTLTPQATSACEPVDVSNPTPYESMIWSASVHSGNPASYTLTEVLQSDFTLDKNKLKQAVSELSSEFEAASNSYTYEEKGLKKNTTSSGIVFTDLNSMSSPEFNRWIDELSNTPIELESGKLVHTYSICVDGVDFIVLHAHHIVMTASMIGEFLNSLIRHYTGDDSNKDTQSKEPFKLFDNNDSQYWQKAYSPDTEYIQLPWSELRSASPRNNGRTLVKNLPRETKRIVDDHVKKFGTTKFTFYRSVFSILMHRISNQSSICIGSSVDLRHGNPLSDVPAQLNTLPISSSLEPDQDFISYTQTAEQTVREALSHRFMPLSEIIKLHPFQQDRLIGPFNVMFDYIEKDALYAVADLGSIISRQHHNASSKYDLTLTVAGTKNQEDSHYNLYWEYDTDLLDTETVEHMASMFNYLCEALATMNRTPIRQIPLLDERSATEMLMIGEGPTLHRDEESFYSRFSSVVSATPDAVAVKCGNTSTSYRDLSYIIDYYSSILSEHNIPAETPVAVFMDRSVEMIAAIVALWRLGLAYVPIETTLPLHRIRAMLQVTNMQYIITKKAYVNKIPDADKLKIIDESSRPSVSGRTLSALVGSETLAYVIFTSGSTGNPKGVMIEHGGMMNHADGMIEYLNLSASSTVAQTASHSFDISVWQLTTILLVGGCIAIYSKDEQADMAAFTEKIEQDKVTIMELVPSYIAAYLEYLNHSNDYSRLKNLRALISTGENISQRIIDDWFESSLSAKLINAYGPAEASDDTNLYTFDNSSYTRHLRGLPIGASLPNVNVYVLDEALNPQPYGVQGEIFVAGIAVGRGYINDSERTEASFINHPVTGERLYKTGDIGYWSSDKELIYMGRSDYQVKLHGFRIELEEIEAHIASYPEVSSAVVVVASKNNSKQLHAYITSSISLNTDNVQNYLREHIPAYMVPSSIVQLPALPLNNSGKVDRKLLTDKQRLRFKEAVDIASHTPNEYAVMDVWKDVFNLEKVGAYDDYYALGGDSITSFRIYSKLKLKGYSVDLHDVLAYPVLKEFAQKISLKNISTPNTTPPSIQGPLALTSVQTRSIRANRDGVMAQYVHVRGKWRADRLNKAIQSALRRHGSFYLIFSENSQQFGSALQARPSYLFRDNSITKSTAYSHLLKDLSDGKLFSYGVRTESNYVTDLYMAANHLVIDIVSWHHLLSEIADKYERDAEVAGYKDYSYGRWVAAIASSQQISDKDATHWREILETSKPAISQLRSCFLDDIPDKQLSTMELPISQPINDTKAYSVVLKALARTVGTKSVSILIETHGRYGELTGDDISQTVGWFTQVLPISTVDAEKPYRELEQELAPMVATSHEMIMKYGELLKQGTLDQSYDPPVIVNYLGRIHDSTFSFDHGPSSLPIGSELMECSIYEDDSHLYVDILSYATPNDASFIKRFQSNIKEALIEVNSQNRASVDDERLKAIMKRIRSNDEQ